MRVRLALLLCVLLAATTAIAWELQWYGHAAFRVLSPTWDVTLTDPFISKNPKTPVELKVLSKLGKVDLILLTHGHGDHIGDTARISKTAGARVVVNADLGRTLTSGSGAPLAPDPRHKERLDQAAGSEHHYHHGTRRA